MRNVREVSDQFYVMTNRTATRGPAPHPDRELAVGRHLRLNAAQAIHGARHGHGTDRIEHVTLHPRRERLLPRDADRHSASVRSRRYARVTMPGSLWHHADFLK